MRDTGLCCCGFRTEVEILALCSDLCRSAVGQGRAVGRGGRLQRRLPSTKPLTVSHNHNLQPLMFSLTRNAISRSTLGARSFSSTINKMGSVSSLPLEGQGKKAGHGTRQATLSRCSLQLRSGCETACVVDSACSGAVVALSPAELVGVVEQRETDDILAHSPSQSYCQEPYPRRRQELPQEGRQGCHALVGRFCLLTRASPSIRLIHPPPQRRHP